MATPHAVLLAPGRESLSCMRAGRASMYATTTRIFCSFVVCCGGQNLRVLLKLGPTKASERIKPVQIPSMKGRPPFPGSATRACSAATCNWRCPCSVVELQRRRSSRRAISQQPFASLFVASLFRRLDRLFNIGDGTSQSFNGLGERIQLVISPTKRSYAPSRIYCCCRVRAHGFHPFLLQVGRPCRLTHPVRPQPAPAARRLRSAALASCVAARELAPK